MKRRPIASDSYERAVELHDAVKSLQGTKGAGAPLCRSAGSVAKTTERRSCNKLLNAR
jgi:hypothetical protein